MAPAKCTKCGASEFIEQNGMYICQYCGAQYPIETNETVNPVPAANTTSQANNGQDVNVHVHMDYSNVVLKSEKKWGVTLALCIFLGYLGIHRFYAGKIGTGILWLITAGIFGIGWIVDIIVILVGGFKDKSGLPIKRR
ncbi:MAG: NINE protein [Clostridiales bacterium]|nr:NINE protein [Clostridiales bacterium]